MVADHRVPDFRRDYSPEAVEVLAVVEEVLPDPDDFGMGEELEDEGGDYNLFVLGPIKRVRFV